MLIDPIDSVKLIQSLQAQCNPTPLSAHIPTELSSHPFAIHQKTHIHTKHFTVLPMQCAAYKCIFHRSWSSYLLGFCPIMATHSPEINIMGISVVSANACRSVLSFVRLSNCTAVGGLSRKYDMSYNYLKPLLVVKSAQQNGNAYCCGHCEDCRLESILSLIVGKVTLWSSDHHINGLS